MGTSLIRGAAAVAFAGVCCWPAVALGQTPQETKPDNVPSVVLLGLGSFGRPLHLNAGADVLFLIGPASSEDGALLSQGIVAGGSAGLGGFQLSAGVFKAGLPAVFSGRLVLTQTTKHAHVSDPRATYLGASVGITVLYFFRANFGVDHRIRGTGERKTLYVWSVGVHFWLWDSRK